MPALPFIGGALMGAVDRFRSDPVSQARKWLQNGLTLLFASWIIMSLFGRRLAADGEPEAEREFDVSEWVDAKLGEPVGGDSSGDGGSSSASGSSGPFPEQGTGLEQMRWATGAAGVPSSWADSPALWNILLRESSSTPQHLEYGPIGSPTYAEPFELLIPNRYGVTNSSSKQAKLVGGLHYIKDRYRTPERAWAFWQAHNWY